MDFFIVDGVWKYVGCLFGGWLVVGLGWRDDCVFFVFCVYCWVIGWCVVWGWIVDSGFGLLFLCGVLVGDVGWVDWRYLVFDLWWNCWGFVDVVWLVVFDDVVGWVGWGIFGCVLYMLLLFGKGVVVGVICSIDRF